ncbi:hypothetical protein GCM10010468_56810 [Actinocorallia longicatena]|uniref:Uncharacterized protein n=1 Tax=Actinocorallia longicatena TaxID=111803 RepID=A0ABP6QFZ7_9ACTN
MLAVGVDLDDGVITLAPGVPETGPHGAADAEVEGQPHHGGAVQGGHPRGAVMGAVIDDENVQSWADGMKFGQDPGYRILFVPRRHDDEGSFGHGGSSIRRVAGVL